MITVHGVASLLWKVKIASLLLAALKLLDFKHFTNVTKCGQQELSVLKQCSRS